MAPPALIWSAVRPPLGVQGLGHKVKPLADDGRAEARSAGIRRPDGVTLSFQVRRNKVEPSEPVFRRNLLAKDMLRL